MLESLVDNCTHDGVDAKGDELDCEVAQFWHIFISQKISTYKTLNVCTFEDLSTNYVTFSGQRYESAKFPEPLDKGQKQIAHVVE